MNIKFLTKNQIDKEKWDNCIDKSSNSLIYAYSWYLDTVVDNWGGLVNNDYSCVMPIAFRSKLGLNYIYRPFLVQQLGVFCENENKIQIDKYIQLIPKKFKHIVYNFNSDNIIERTESVTNNNYVLNLNFEYNTLKRNFSKNSKTYISKSEKNNLTIEEDIDFKLLINLKRENLPNKLNKQNFNKMKELHLKLKRNSLVLGVYSQSTLISAAFFAFSNNTFYYLAAATSKLGRKKSASFFLLNYFIKKHSNQPYKLDFEGSNIPGVARFFAGWGAKNFRYSTISINNLPFFLKKFKK